SSSTTRIRGGSATTTPRPRVAPVLAGRRQEARARMSILPLPGLDPDVAAVRLGDVADDRQPETSPTRRAAARLVHAVEPLEDPFEVARRNADAVVAYLDHPAILSAMRRHFDRRPRLRVLHGIVEQVREGRDQLG